LQNLLRRFCKRRIQKPEFSIQNCNPFTGNVFYFSDSCLLYSDFFLAKHPRVVLQELYSEARIQYSELEPSHE
jgi:hypothetical protein